MIDLGQDTASGAKSGAYPAPVKSSSKNSATRATPSPSEKTCVSWSTEESDLFDVLNYVAYQRDMVPRLDRAVQATIQIKDYDPKQQVFLNFVLMQYVKEGVSELDDAKLGDLIKLNDGSIEDAKEQLGAIKDIRETFIGFQEHLYQAEA